MSENIHYSAKLRNQIKQKEQAIAEKNAMIDQFSKFLNSPKFNCGDELDRLISTSDVQDWLGQIREVGCE